MKFTTRFGLHSQTTRLFETSLVAPTDAQPATGFSPSVMPCSKELWPRTPVEKGSLDYNSTSTKLVDFKFELIPLHSPLLGESLLVSFPPLIDMLKFSG